MSLSRRGLGLTHSPPGPLLPFLTPQGSCLQIGLASHPCAGPALLVNMHVPSPASSRSAVLQGNRKPGCLFGLEVLLQAPCHQSVGAPKSTLTCGSQEGDALQCSLLTHKKLAKKMSPCNMGLKVLGCGAFRFSLPAP